MLPITVAMITFNHEKYIGEAIESILMQTFTNFELIIVNDGSTDKTEEVIKNFKDDRIIYIYQKNQGPSVARNNCILAAQGKYIASMSGDDVCYPDRLEKQYQHICESEHKIIFSWVDFIDDDSQRLKQKDNFAKHSFNHVNRSRAEILNRFFFKGNYLSAPSALIERDILLQAGLFCVTSIQLQDFEMWIKLIKKYDIYIIPEKLIKYRIRTSEQGNLSHPSNYVRANFEQSEILKSFFQDISIEFFKESFGMKLKNPAFESLIEYEIEKAFLYLSHYSTIIQSIGASHLFNLLQDPKILAIAEDKYNFGLSDLFKLNQNLMFFNLKYEKLEREINLIKNSPLWKVRSYLVRLKKSLM